MSRNASSEVAKRVAGDMGARLRPNCHSRHYGTSLSGSSRPRSVDAALARRLGVREGLAHKIRYRVRGEMLAVLEAYLECGRLTDAAALYAEAGVALIHDLPAITDAEQDHDFADADEDKEQAVFRVVRSREAAAPYARKLAIEWHHGRIYHAVLCREYDLTGS